MMPLGMNPGAMPMGGGRPLFPGVIPANSPTGPYGGGTSTGPLDHSFGSPVIPPNSPQGPWGGGTSTGPRDNGMIPPNSPQGPYGGGSSTGAPDNRVPFGPANSPQGPYGGGSSTGPMDGSAHALFQNEIRRRLGFGPSAPMAAMSPINQPPSMTPAPGPVGFTGQPAQSSTWNRPNLLSQFMPSGQTSVNPWGQQGSPVVMDHMRPQGMGY